MPPPFFSKKSSKTSTFLINVFMLVISLGGLVDVPRPDWQRAKRETIAAARGEGG